MLSTVSEAEGLVIKSKSIAKPAPVKPLAAKPVAKATATPPVVATAPLVSRELPAQAPTDFRPYIKPFRVYRHALRFLFATPEAQQWYDPIKPYAQLEYEWVASHLRLQNEHVVDVGTHHGHYALLLASMDPASLTCIDAVESNCAIAEANLCLNGFDPFVRHLAITTKQGKAQFTGESNGRVVDRGVVEVSGVRLPTIANEATVVKLDIEGEEFRVIPDQIDELPNVHTWIVEIHPWKTRDPHMLMPLFQERFGDIRWVNRATMRVEPYPGKSADWSTHSTIFCRK